MRVWVWRWKILGGKRVAKGWLSLRFKAAKSLVSAWLNCILVAKLLLLLPLFLLLQRAHNNANNNNNNFHTLKHTTIHPHTHTHTRGHLHTYGSISSNARCWFCASAFPVPIQNPKTEIRLRLRLRWHFHIFSYFPISQPGFRRRASSNNHAIPATPTCLPAKCVTVFASNQLPSYAKRGK